MKIEILPGLWLGKSDYSTNGLFLKNKNISCLINCNNDLNFLGKSDNFNHEIKKNMEKYEVLKLKRYLIETTEKINKKIINGENVFIYCDDCCQKSPTLVLAYIIRYGFLNKVNSIKLMRTKIKNIFTPYLIYEITIDKYSDEILK
jgi:hypothetical protein